MTSGNGYVPRSERLSVEAYQSSVGDYLIYLFHVATYEFAREFVRGLRVLDFGCGTGYGAQRLADECATIVGVDISADAIDYARRTYSHPNLSYQSISRIEEAPLPFPDNAFDAVLSFQVVEHINDVDSYLDEIYRVLVPDGRFICATPDRRFRLFRRQRPWNIYHVREYAPSELADTLNRRFAGVEILGMTAPREMFDTELRRYRRMRVVTLPMTFPGVPEALRVGGLRLLKQVQRRRRRSRPATTSRFGFDHSVVRIEADATPSANIVAVAQTTQPKQ